ncbi:MAG: hypothetical protein Q9M33_08025, partial [Robiginitomaculum sp.]|nr:hypothetical protein [Robiginitomaculum sp.]
FLRTRPPKAFCAKWQNFMMPDKDRHVVLLSNSIIETDPRVRKFAQTLCDAGWVVTTVGLPPSGQIGDARPWSALHIDPAKGGAEPSAKSRVFSSLLSRLFSVMAQGMKPLSKPGATLLAKAASRTHQGQGVWKRALYYWWLGFGLRVFPKGYQSIFWQSDPRYHLFLETTMADVGAADLWIANDWDMLPIALALKAKKGGKVLYDSHEYAVEQFVGNAGWRHFKQPLVKAVERDCIRKADAVSSVSPGLCSALQVRYGLARTPTCIRNIPQYQKFEFRPCGQNITVLYQGVVGPGRALEEIIISTPLWRNDYRLVIRGPEGTTGYIDRLKNIIDTIRPVIEIEIAPPVPFDEMIAKAHEADIGIMALPDWSIHNQYALPNKVFEYMMAGLALCVSNHADMANILAYYRNGTLIEACTPASIANAVNSMDAEKIDASKHASLQATQTLNWEVEQAAFLAICRLCAPECLATVR